jgi:outer membrane protein TolC
MKFSFFATGIFALGMGVAGAQPSNAAGNTIDLPTVLRLAGARNLDVQIARERLNEAQAGSETALEQFVPSLTPGIAYHRRDGMAQAVPAGTISETHLQSYAPGATVAAQMALGDAIYQSLAARQLVKASGQAFEAQRQDSALNAAQDYFDLAKAKALADVLKEAAGISSDYQQELHEAVGAGIAFKGDELRVQTQTERDQIALRQAVEKQRVAAVNLAQVLHLDSTVDLVPLDADLVPLLLFPTNAALDSLVQQALNSRPELKAGQALVMASRDAKNGAVYGPLVPSIGAQVFAGGLGGGHDGQPGNFGDSEDYLIGAGWRIGPGGLFDFGRIKANRSRLAATQLGQTKLKDAVIAQVVSAATRVQSLSDQIVIAQQNLATANEAFRLTRERKQYGVGIVLEDIQSQQALTQARSDYVTAVAEHDKAQYELNKAVGGLPMANSSDESPHPK